MLVCHSLQTERPENLNITCLYLFKTGFPFNLYRAYIVTYFIQDNLRSEPNMYSIKHKIKSTQCNMDVKQQIKRQT